jgi:DNA-binding NarL/FixJ family response regulator
MERLDHAHDPLTQHRLLILAGRVLWAEALAALFRQVAGCGEVETATDVDQAVGRAAGFRPDSVLLDWNLPGGAAVLAARLIRLECPHVGLVFLDDTVHASRVLATRRLRASGYFTQDEPFEALLAGIREVGSGGSAFCPSAEQCLASAARRESGGPSIEQPGFEKLTRRELEVLVHLARGLTVKQCAAKMALAPSTVDNHKSRLMHKLGVHKAVDLVHVAIRENLVR